jgi:hypothetical protein
MSEQSQLEYWDIWYPKATATGMSVARGLVDPTQIMLAHALPDVITVEIRDREGSRLAFGADLERTMESPMCRLTRSGAAITREDFWPTEADYGLPVLLPGGEAGILRSWWNAGDRKEWRWDLELYNSIR